MSNGVVLLEGAVASEDDKRRATSRLEVLPHVTRIDNHLTVNSQAVEGATAVAGASPNPDSTMSAEVANEIAAALADEPTLANCRVNVTVRGDTIALTGSVGTKQQRQRALEIARSFALHSHVEDKLTVDRRLTQGRAGVEH